MRLVSLPTDSLPPDRMVHDRQYRKSDPRAMDWDHGCFEWYMIMDRQHLSVYR